MCQIILTHLPFWNWYLLIFLNHIEIFLILGMTSDFQLKPEYLGYYAIELWILFKPLLGDIF